MKCSSVYIKDGKCVHLIPPELCSKQTEFLCVEKMKPPIDKKLTLSHSSRMSFTHCRHKYWLRKVKGITIKDTMKSTPLKMGSIWDKFMEHQYANKTFTQSDFWKLVEFYQLDQTSSGKVYALIRAYHKLGINVESGGDPQAEFTLDRNESYAIRGFMDCKYVGYFTEDKLSGRPDFYEKKFNLISQFSTYFLADPKLEYGIVRIARVPGTRTGKGKYEDESQTDYSNRVYSDIISRPSHYFMGYSRIKKTYGRRFFRSEFPLDDIEKQYGQVSDSIRNAHKKDAFYQNFTACHVPLDCEYIKVCDTGYVSEEVFDIKEKEDQ